MDLTSQRRRVTEGYLPNPVPPILKLISRRLRRCMRCLIYFFAHFRSGVLDGGPTYHSVLGTGTDVRHKVEDEQDVRRHLVDMVLCVPRVFRALPAQHLRWLQPAVVLQRLLVHLTKQTVSRGTIMLFHFSTQVTPRHCLQSWRRSRCVYCFFLRDSNAASEVNVCNISSLSSDRKYINHSVLTYGSCYLFRTDFCMGCYVSRETKIWSWTTIPGPFPVPGYSYNPLRMRGVVNDALKRGMTIQSNLSSHPANYGAINYATAVWKCHVSPRVPRSFCCWHHEATSQVFHSVFVGVSLALGPVWCRWKGASIVSV